MAPSKPWRVLALVAAALWPGLQAGAAQAPSVLIPATRADQGPVAATYRPSLEGRLHPAAAAEFTPFVLRGVQVLGSSLAPDLLVTAYASRLGHRFTQADLNDVVEAIAKLYATRSDIALYGLSVTAQSFQDGRVRIDATEGYIQGARVTAPARARHGGALLRRYLDRLTGERPLRRSTLERYTALIRDIAGLNPTLSFEVGSRPGGFILVVAEAPKPVEVGLSINNRGTAFLGRTQAEADLALHGLLQQGDDTHLTVALPTDLPRFQYYGVSHAQPVGATGASVLATAGYLRTRPSFADLHGRALTLGLSATAPVLRRNAQSLYLTAGLDSVDSTNALLGDQITSDRIRTVRLGGSYVRQDPRYFLLVNGSANFGLNGLGAHVLAPDLATLAFAKYTAKISANVALSPTVVLRLDSTGQYTSDRLPGSEQIALGGEAFGRAYEAAVVAGDEGVAGSAELAWKATRLAPPALGSSELYAFADGGETHRLVRPLQPAATQDVASVGAGARIALKSRAVVQLEGARGLLNPVAAEDHESWRAVFSVKSSF